MFSFLSEFRTAQKLSSQTFHVIFFAENAYYFQYFRYLFEALVKIPGIRIAYITSDKNDAILQDKRITAVYLKSTLAGIFPRLQAHVMIMTMPDLQHYLFKKSPGVKKYVYVFHALVSTHQQYRAHAFDHYDAIFCTGQQQEKEIREAEAIYSLPRKECIPYGYPLLEDIREKANALVPNENKILIAPSWYSEGILNTCIESLIDELTAQQRTIWIRPHPEFFKRNKKRMAKLLKTARETGSVQIDTTPSVYTHLTDAGILVTDRSGIALEFAFATYRPVLFINTPLKIQNPDIGRFTLEPVENVVRDQLGIGIQPEELYKAENVLQQLKDSTDIFRISIKEVERDTVYPPDHWQNGVDYIKNQLFF